MPTLERHRPNTPAWFDLMTSDAEGARAFYGHLFGWTFDIGGPDYGFYAIALKGDGVAAGLGQIPSDGGFPPSWTVYFAVESADHTAALVNQHGGRVIMPPMDVGTKGRMAIFADPTGAVFGVWQPREHTGATIIHAPGSMTWCEVNTRDTTGASAFYKAVFGLEAQKIDSPDMNLPTAARPAAGPRRSGPERASDTANYHTLHLYGQTMAGMLQMTAEWGEIPPHWMAYFAVEDTDQAVAKVDLLGGKTMHGPFDTPYGRMAVVADPQGAIFSIIKPNYA